MVKVLEWNLDMFHYHTVHHLMYTEMLISLHHHTLDWSPYLSMDDMVENVVRYM